MVWLLTHAELQSSAFATAQKSSFEVVVVQTIARKQIVFCGGGCRLRDWARPGIFTGLSGGFLLTGALPLLLRIDIAVLFPIH